MGPSTVAPARQRRRIRAVQPIAFSHRLRSTDLQINCHYCYAGANTARYAGSALMGHWLDLYVMIVPSVLPDRPMPGLLEVGMALGIGAASAWVLRDWLLQNGRALSATADKFETFKA